jgi:hypothetical protein
MLCGHSISHAGLRFKLCNSDKLVGDYCIINYTVFFHDVWIVIKNCSSVQHNDFAIAVLLQARWDSTHGITQFEFWSKALLVCSIYNFGRPVKNS